MRPEDVPGAHARGYNANSLGVCYEGGLDVNGRPPTRGLAAERGDAQTGGGPFAELSGGSGGGAPGSEP